MNQLTDVLIRFCKATNIFIEPSSESIDLSLVFSQALQEGHITEKTFLEIQSCIK